MIKKNYMVMMLCMMIPFSAQGSVSDIANLDPATSENADRVADTKEFHDQTQTVTNDHKADTLDHNDSDDHKAEPLDHNHSESKDDSRKSTLVTTEPQTVATSSNNENDADLNETILSYIATMKDQSAQNIEETNKRNDAQFLRLRIDLDNAKIEQNTLKTTINALQAQVQTIEIEKKQSKERLINEIIDLQSEVQSNRNLLSNLQKEYTTLADRSYWLNASVISLVAINALAAAVVYYLHSPTQDNQQLHDEIQQVLEQNPELILAYKASGNNQALEMLITQCMEKTAHKTSPSNVKRLICTILDDQPSVAPIRQ